MKREMMILICLLGMLDVPQCSTTSLAAIRSKQSGPSLTYMTYLSRRICQNKHFETVEQNYTISQRIYMVQQAGRQLIMKSFRGDIFKSNFNNIWIVVLWVGLFLGLAYLVLRKYHRSILILKKNADKTIFDIPEQVKISKIFYVVMLICLIIISYTGLSGIVVSLQARTAVQDTVCSMIVGNNKINHNMLVRQGQGRSPFHADALYYQFRLLNIRQKATQILRSQTYRQFETDLLMAKSNINNNIFSLFQKNYENLTINLNRLTNQTMMVEGFICYIKERIERNRNEMIKMFRMVDKYIGKIQNLPGLISFWFATIFLIVLLGNVMIGCAFASYFYKRQKMARKLIQKGTSVVSFFVFIGLISLFGLFVTENLIYLNCLKLDDYQNKILFEKYFERYNDYEEPALRELMRKIYGHSLSNLQTAYHYDIQELSKTSLAAFASFKQTYNSSQHLIESQRSPFSSNHLTQTNNNQTIMLLNYKKIINYLQQCEQDLINIFQLSPRSPAMTIYNYSLSEIRDYSNIIKQQICKKDLDIIFQINNFMFVSIAGILIEFTIFTFFFRKMQISFVKIENDTKVEENTAFVKSSQNSIMSESQNLTYFKNQQSQNDRL